MLTAEENEKTGLLDLPVNSRTPKTRNIWPIVAAILAILLTLVLLNRTLNRSEEPFQGNESPLYKSSEYTKTVRRNVRNLLADRPTILYQPLEGTIRPLLNKMAKYTTVPQNGLSHCFVSKIMATTLNTLFCYLRHTEGFEKAKMNMKRVYWGNRFCGANGTVEQTAQLVDYIGPKHVTFQLTRDPIKRFVSSFVNKCILERHYRAKLNDTQETCYGCNEDIKCVVVKLYYELSLVSRYDSSLPWSKFRNYFTEHFMPLTWYCDIAKRYKEIEYIRYVSGGEKKAEMADSIIDIMEKRGIEKYKLEKIKGVLLDDQPYTHATKSTDLPAKYMKEIYDDKEILDWLMKIYYYDFIVFDYPMPEIKDNKH